MFVIGYWLFAIGYVRFAAASPSPSDSLRSIFFRLSAPRLPSLSAKSCVNIGFWSPLPFVSPSPALLPPIRPIRPIRQRITTPKGFYIPAQRLRRSAVFRRYPGSAIGKNSSTLKAVASSTQPISAKSCRLSALWLAPADLPDPSHPPVNQYPKGVSHISPVVATVRRFPSLPWVSNRENSPTLKAVGSSTQSKSAKSCQLSVPRLPSARSVPSLRLPRLRGLLGCWLFP
jgi:hypothetical protein